MMTGSHKEVWKEMQHKFNSSHIEMKKQEDSNDFTFYTTASAARDMADWLYRQNTEHHPEGLVLEGQTTTLEQDSQYRAIHFKMHEKELKKEAAAGWPILSGTQPLPPKKLRQNDHKIKYKNGWKGFLSHKLKRLKRMAKLYMHRKKQVKNTKNSYKHEQDTKSPSWTGQDVKQFFEKRYTAGESQQAHSKNTDMEEQEKFLMEKLEDKLKAQEQRFGLHSAQPRGGVTTPMKKQTQRKTSTPRKPVICVRKGEVAKHGGSPGCKGCASVSRTTYHNRSCQDRFAATWEKAKSGQNTSDT